MEFSRESIEASAKSLFMSSSRGPIAENVLDVLELDPNIPSPAFLDMARSLSEEFFSTPNLSVASPSPAKQHSRSSGVSDRQVAFQQPNFDPESSVEDELSESIITVEPCETSSSTDEIEALPSSSRNIPEDISVDAPSCFIVTETTPSVPDDSMGGLHTEDVPMETVPVMHVPEDSESDMPNIVLSIPLPGFHRNRLSRRRFSLPEATIKQLLRRSSDRSSSRKRRRESSGTSMSSRATQDTSDTIESQDIEESDSLGEISVTGIINGQNTESSKTGFRTGEPQRERKRQKVLSDDIDKLFSKIA